MTATTTQEAAVMQRLSTLDRFLPLWIGLAMAVGLGLGSLIPGFDDALDSLRIGTVSLPIAIGLLLMMYPVLAKVRYEEIGRLKGERGLMGASLFLNWVVGPALMFALAWIFLADQPEYRTGLIIVGLARCIAMVLIWSDLAKADNEATALLVAINSLFQIVAYSLLGWFYLTALPDLLGLDSQGFEVGIWEVARTVLIFLGIPLLAGYLTREIGIKRRGARWYEETFLPRIGPIALYGLLFTIVMLFAIQGDAITSRPWDVVLDRGAAAHLLPDHVQRQLLAGQGHRPLLPQDRDARLHRRLEQLRAGHRRGRRGVRRHLRAGPGRRRRPADRSPGPGRAGLRRSLGRPTVVLDR